MKKVIVSMLAIAGLVFVACDDDDPPVIPPTQATCTDGVQNGDETGVDCGGSSCQACQEQATCNDGIQNGDETGIDIGGACSEIINVSGEITEDTTWMAKNMYILAGKVVVGKGVTLTIEPGTIIKGKEGSGSLASALIVQRDSKIMAEGTAEKPIIFTANKDNIGVGQTAGTNLDENQRGLWGGVIILGRAKGSFKGDVTETQIEGIPADDPFGTYGGGDAPNDDDDSGSLKYVSIRHGGALIGEGNEINGLTLGAVGSQTKIDNIEIVGNVDDGIEFFGGTVSATNILLWAGADDGLDVDQAYSGTIDNAIVIAGNQSDNSFEIDGGEGSMNASFTIKNVTLIGNSEQPGRYGDFRDNAMGTLENIYAVDFANGKKLQLSGNVVAQNLIDGKLVFKKWEVAGADSSIFFEKPEEGESAIIPDLTTMAAGWTSQVTAGAETVGADTSVFGWTYANAKANLGF